MTGNTDQGRTTCEIVLDQLKHADQVRDTQQNDLVFQQYTSQIYIRTIIEITTRNDCRIRSD